MNKSDESILIKTAALQAAIEGADVSPEFRDAFLAGLTEAHVFLRSETIEWSELQRVVRELITEKRVSLDVDFGTMMGIIALLRRQPGAYRERVLISVALLRITIEETAVSLEFMLDFIVGLTEAGVFAGETIDSIELGMAIGRLVPDGKVSDGADFAVMTAAIAELDPDIVIQ